MYESPISDVFNLMGNAVDGSAGLTAPDYDPIPTDEF